MFYENFKEGNDRIDPTIYIFVDVKRLNRTKNKIPIDKYNKLGLFV